MYNTLLAMEKLENAFIRSIMKQLHEAFIILKSESVALGQTYYELTYQEIENFPKIDDTRFALEMASLLASRIPGIEYRAVQDLYYRQLAAEDRCKDAKKRRKYNTMRYKVGR